mmetsp:Transcript_34134/g.33702  ORF Transcript_34134/g.33702 Transcript_34134/m.33702 type:complete len:674 (-) Transcript_34134:304-2325(-)
MPEHTKELGFIKLLQGLLQDGNAIVVANAVAALFEISRVAGKNYLKANKETIGKLLNALNETNEWGQIYILESIINYKPKEQKEAEEIIERIMPRLQHANPAVVLGATKNVLHFLKFVNLKSNKTTILKKLSAPLITLLSSEPEIQYIALCNILLILQQIPNVFEKNVKMFFCRFSDPIYVKLAKLDVMVGVADNTNVDIIITELHEYCNNIDQDFVRRSVKAIGQVVVKVDRVAKKGVEALREHVNQEQGSDSALQEAVIVASKILRKYPKKFEGLVKDIVKQQDRIDEPESKSAFIWILGEYSKKIEDAGEKLQVYIDSFTDENINVCLQILTSAVKMFIKDSDNYEDMVMNVLKLASESSANPDLRDRGYIYWRMLSTDPSQTKDTVLAKRPEVEEDLTKLMDDETRDIFIDIFISDTKHSALRPEKTASAPEPDSDEEVEEEEKPKKSKKKDKKSKKQKKVKEEETKEEIELPEEVVTEDKPKDDLDDIFGLGIGDDPVSNDEPAVDPLAGILDEGNGGGESTQAASPWDDNGLFGGFGASGSEASLFIKSEHAEVLSSSTPGSQNKAAGLQIKARFYREGTSIKLDMIFYNSTGGIISDFDIMINKNPFGLKPGPISVIPISAGQTFTTTVECSIDQSNADLKNPPQCPYYVQTAIKNSLDVYYFQVP